MTTFQHVDFLCRVCERGFRSPTVASTDVGGTRTDFHQRAAGTQPLAYQVHSCPHCGYAGVQEDFSDDAVVTPMLKERVWSELAPTIVSGPASGSEKYEAAAKVAEWRDSEVQRVAELLLRAAWCCVDEGDIEAERYFRRKAAWKFEEALQSYDGVAREERAVLTYLVAELWRRVGLEELAAEWFDRVALEVVDARTQQWIIDAARQQRDRPREWFR